MAYTTIDDPSAFFQTKLYTGNGGSNALTLDGNSDLQPDWVWIKNRNGTQDHHLFDSVRGTLKRLESNSNTNEETRQNSITSYDSDGFTLGSYANTNTNDDTYVAWNWKAGGSSSVNSDGDTNSSVSASTTAGVSVVSYTGAGATTYGHGLGATPNVIIIKKRTTDSGNNNWFVYHDKVITAGGSNKSFLTLNETGALAANGSATTFTSVSSTTFGVGTDDIISESSHTFIAYCFTEKQGYSKFSNYTGNGNANGAFVYTGFKPAFLITKRTDADGEGWLIHDSKRLGYNAGNSSHYANSTATEASGGYLDLVSTGFKARSTNGVINASGGTYVYLAFAENPFVTSTGIPATAR